MKITDYCRQFTGSLCPPKFDLLASVDYVENEDNCLKFCSDVYSGLCKRYEYHTLEQRCFLYNTTEGFSNIADCQKIGGPDYPSIDACNKWFADDSTTADGKQDCKVQLQPSCFIQPSFYFKV